MLSTNQTLQKGRYRVIQQFTTDSRHGMYEAYDNVSDSNVVLREHIGSQAKVFTHSQREASDTAFFREAKALLSLKHASLVSVHDYFSEIGCQYLVLEAIEGFDLTKYLDAGAKRPQLSVALKWADQLLNALHFLHRHSPPVVHGSIRPENIRFTSGGDVKLLFADVNSMPNGATSADRVVQNGGFDYQPFEKIWAGLDTSEQQSFLKDYDERAERLLRGPADARSDLYSIGACIYQVLSGVMPTYSLERATALRDKKPDPLQKLCDLEKSIPVEISDAVMKALEIRRELRFYSAVIMAEVLRTAVVKVDERSADSNAASDALDLVPTTTGPAEVVTDMFVNAIPDFAPTGGDARQCELEEEQLELEAEQKRIEERRQAIEAERSRLKREAELERQKAEQERRAEEKRLLEAKAEEDRSQAAKRLAEIEAEIQKRLAEAERQELEAEGERQRAEKRLADIQTERARRLDEEQKAAAAVREDLLRAEQRLLELSHLDSPVELHISTDPLDNDLLEIDTSTPTPAIVSTVPKPLIELIDQPVDRFSPTRQIAEPDFGSKGFKRASKFSWKVPVIGVAVALLVAVVFGWMFLSSNLSEPLPAIEVQTSAPATEADPLPVENVVSVEQPVVIPEQSPAEPSPVETFSTENEPTLVSSQEKNVRTTETVKTQEKPKKLAQVGANKPVPKKVTVDDLINDN